MNPASFDFFRQLLETPSPSGYEEKAQEVVRQWAKPFADEVRTDVHGNVIAIKNPTGSPRILLDGHIDQIGLIVQHVDEQGFIYTSPIGGWDPQILLGQTVVVWTDHGPIPGVIARKPKHLLTNDEMKKVPEVHELWVDIGVANKGEALSLIKIGDPITVRLGITRMHNNLVFGPKMDNTAGIWVVFEALRLLSDRTFDPALYVVSAVQEEIGLRGAQTAGFGVDPHVAIAVDVTHATDCPTIDKRQIGEAKLGEGPVVFRGPNVNPIVHKSLMSLASSHQLKIQPKAANRGLSNDSNILQLTRAGVAVGCLGIPNRYMHSPVEMISLSDLVAASELLAHFVQSVSRNQSFIPGNLS